MAIAARVIPAGLGGYGTERDRPSGGATVPQLLVIDVAVFAALIVVAAVVTMRHRRRTGGPSSVRPGAVAELAGQRMRREVPVLPGFRDDAGEPAPSAHDPAGPGQAGEPAGPEQADEAARPGQEAQPQVSGAAAPEPEPGAPAPEPEPGAPAPEPEPDGPAPEPDGHPVAAGEVTSSGQIGSYYAGADRPIADYLAELGWAEEPGPRDPR